MSKYCLQDAKAFVLEHGMFGVEHLLILGLRLDCSDGLCDGDCCGNDASMSLLFRVFVRMKKGAAVFALREM